MELRVSPRLERAAASGYCLGWNKYSSESDFLRVAGGGAGSEGGSTPGLLVAGEVLWSEEGDESAVMKVSWETSEREEGLRGEMSSWFVP